MRGRVGSFTGVPVNHNGEFMRNKGLRVMVSTFPLSDALFLFLQSSYLLFLWYPLSTYTVNDGRNFYMDFLGFSVGTHLQPCDGQVNTGFVRYCCHSLQPFNLITPHLIVMSSDWSGDLGLKGSLNVLEQMSRVVWALWLKEELLLKFMWHNIFLGIPKEA